MAGCSQSISMVAAWSTSPRGAGFPRGTSGPPNSRAVTVRMVSPSAPGTARWRASSRSKPRRQPAQGEGDGHRDLPGERRRERDAQRGEEVDDVDPPRGLGRLQPDDHAVAHPGLQDATVVGHQHLGRDPVPVLLLLHDRDRDLDPASADAGPARVAVRHLLHPEVVGLQLAPAHRLAGQGRETRRVRLLGRLSRVRELGGPPAIVGGDLGLAGGRPAGHEEAAVPAVAPEGGPHREQPPARPGLVHPLLGHLPAHHALPHLRLDEHLLARDPDALALPLLQEDRGLEPAHLLVAHVEPVPLGLGPQRQVVQGGGGPAVPVGRRRLPGRRGSGLGGGGGAGERARGQDSPCSSSHRYTNH